MLTKVISGGQSGADQAALRAARAVGFPTGGLCPLGWKTEDGPAPWLADYGVAEHPSPGYPPRTEANVRESDLTLWVGEPSSPGARVTLRAADSWDRPVYVVAYPAEHPPTDVARWIADHRPPPGHEFVLNVAGNRESGNPGIGAKAEAFLVEVFKLLKEVA